MKNDITTENKITKSNKDVCFVFWTRCCNDKLPCRFLIGVLSKYSSGKYEFKYSFSAETYKCMGFNGIEAFPDFNKTYTSDRLFPVFSSRLPDKNRKDISKILKKYGLKEYDEFQLLIRSGGKLPIDNFEFTNNINLIY